MPIKQVAQGIGTAVGSIAGAYGGTDASGNTIWNWNQ